MNGPFLRPVRGVDPPVRFFGFHHAGGSASAYFRLMRALPGSWDALLYELPGRGRRHREPLPVAVAAVVEDAVTAMRPWLDRPFALFGHSMGAVVAFEVAHRLRAEGRPALWLGLSGRAPSHAGRLDGLAGLDDAALLEWMISMRGTPVAVRESPELAGRAARVLRADLECLAAHEPQRGRSPLDCPITAFGAVDDHLVPVDDLEGWQRYTTASTTVVRYAGHHFSLLAEQLATCAAALEDGVTRQLADDRYADQGIGRSRQAVGA